MLSGNKMLATDHLSPSSCETEVPLNIFFYLADPPTPCCWSAVTVADQKTPANLCDLEMIQASHQNLHHVVFPKVGPRKSQILASSLLSVSGYNVLAHWCIL